MAGFYRRCFAICIGTVAAVAAFANFTISASWQALRTLIFYAFPSPSTLDLATRPALASVTKPIAPTKGAVLDFTARRQARMSARPIDRTPARLAA